MRHILAKVGKNPYLQIAVGVVMLFSSLAGQQGALYSDLLKLDLRVHHGLNAMGIWQIVQALPNLWDSFDWIFNKYWGD